MLNEEILEPRSYHSIYMNVYMYMKKKEIFEVIFTKIVNVSGFETKGNHQLDPLNLEPAFTDHACFNCCYKNFHVRQAACSLDYKVFA